MIEEEFFSQTQILVEFEMMEKLNKYHDNLDTIYNNIESLIGESPLKFDEYKPSPIILSYFAINFLNSDKFDLSKDVIYRMTSYILVSFLIHYTSLTLLVNPTCYYLRSLK